ncbi:MAG TPA: histidinol-phosphate transaminase [Chloroflexota bacterium]|nr:histidinol-phosphate transaminase [Chloroflexota bacterium]
MVRVHSDVRRLLRRDLDRIEAYPAPQPLDEFARLLGVAPYDVLKLDQNENPYGCSPRVSEALRTYDWYHVYPDPAHRVLRGRLADYVGAPVEQILVGNGSDELIELILRMVIEPGDRVLSVSPTFGYYETAALAAGAEYVTVERGPHFAVDPAAVATQVTDRTKVLFLASPNNPTGNAASLETVRSLLALNLIVVVDEAYFEFHRQTALGLFAEGYENLIVLRTFSKWAGLAGLRLGYGVFPTALTPAAWSLKPPYSVSQAALVAGLASLDDLDYLQATVAKILVERQRLADGLAATGYLSPYPTDANFILCDVVGRSAADLQRALAERAILVRRYSSRRLENCIRVSVGRPEQTDRLVDVLKELAR